MEFSTAVQNLNWLAVFVAALSTFIIGGIWYAVFGKNKMASNRFSSEDLKSRKMPLGFGISFLLSFIMSLNLAMYTGKEDMVFGTIAGFMAGFGWVALAIGIISLCENRPLKYVLINGG